MKVMKIGAMVTIATMALGVHASTQDITFKAAVDRNRIMVGESVTLTVTVSGNTAKIPKPELPAMEDFTIQPRGSARNFSFVNGKIHTSVSYTYSLSPRKKGKLTIGEFEIALKGKTYRTTAIEIEVIEKGTQEPGHAVEPSKEHAGDDIFVETFIDKEKVYKGEQIVLTFRLYSAVQIVGNPQYIPAATDDFWRENLGDEIMVTEVINGREYQINELNYAIFPLTAGEKTIGPAQVNAVIDQAITDPFDFGFSTGRNVQLASKPLTIRVLPLPDAPDGFIGGVGDFEIERRLDNDSTKQNEPLTVITTVRGNGNIRDIGVPEIELPGFRSFNSGSSVHIESGGGELRGEKTFKTILIPKKSGDFEIPEGTFVFFDPKRRKYVTKKTERLSFTVIPAEDGEASERVFSPMAIEKIGEDIHFIKLKGNLKEHRGMGPVAALFVLNGLLLAAFLWIAISLEMKERAKANETIIRKRGALRCALKTMDKAKREARKGDVREAYEILQEAILQFFADKCNLSMWGITEDEIVDRVRSLRGAATHEKDIAEILHACNRARYSTEKPDVYTFKSVLERTRRLLKTIQL